MRDTLKKLTILAALITVSAWAEEPSTPPSPRDPVEGVWMLEKIIGPASTVEPDGGFIFLGGHYSTTVNFSQEGIQTNISQFGTYTAQEDRLSLAPSVQVSTRADTVIYKPEHPFSWDLTIIGDEMRGVSVRDGTTFVLRRMR